MTPAALREKGITRRRLESLVARRGTFAERGSSRPRRSGPSERLLWMCGACGSRAATPEQMAEHLIAVHGIDAVTIRLLELALTMAHNPCYIAEARSVIAELKRRALEAR